MPLLQAERKSTAEAFLRVLDNLGFACDWEKISAKRYITWNFVREHQDRPWSYKGLSRNPNITIDIILRYPTKPWDYHEFSHNPGLTWQTIMEHPDFPWDHQVLELHPQLAVMVPENRYTVISPWLDFLPWSTLMTVDLPLDGLTWEFIRDHPGLPWNYPRLSSCELITAEIILEHPRPWSWLGFSANPNLTPEVLLSQSLGLFDFYEVSRNLAIPLDFIRERPDWPWDPDAILSRDDFTLDLVVDLPGLSWDYQRLSEDSRWEDIRRLSLPWNYQAMSHNSQITWKIVKENRNLPWDWTILSSRLDIDWRTVESHPEYPWDYNSLQDNTMDQPLRKQLAWEVRDKFIELLGKPPLGYYFLLDLEQQLRDCHSPDENLIRAWRQTRNHQAIINYFGSKTEKS